MEKKLAGRGHPYPSIGDYGFLSDCHSMALVSKQGSIDWCCMPRIDSGSIFGRRPQSADRCLGAGAG